MNCKYYQNTSLVMKGISAEGKMITRVPHTQPLTSYQMDKYRRSFIQHGNNAVFDQNRPVSYKVLRRISEKAFLINICINHAIRIVSPFAKISTGRNEKGFKISLKDNESKFSAELKNRTKELEHFFLNTGFDKDLTRGDILTFMKKGIRDLLSIDQVTTEIQNYKDGTPYAFWTVDPATIYKKADYNGNTEDIAYIQMIDMIPAASFTSKQMVFGIMNPRSDLEHSLYGYSYVEQAVDLITAMIYSFVYNQGNFTSDNLPRGAILINGDPDQDQVDMIADYIINTMTSPNQKWRIPVFPSGGDERKIEWVSFQKGNRDMEFTEWTNRLWTSTAALFGTDLEELGIRVNTGTSVIPENPEARIVASKSRVLGDILRFFQSHFQSILDLVDSRFLFEFVGLETEDVKVKNETRKNKLETICSINELRKEEGLEPIEEEWADIPLNPQLIALRGQLEGGKAESSEEDEEYASKFESGGLDFEPSDREPNGVGSGKNGKEEEFSKRLGEDMRKSHKYIRREWKNGQWAYEYPQENTNRRRSLSDIAGKTKLIDYISPLIPTRENIDKEFEKLSNLSRTGKLRCKTLGNQPVVLTSFSKKHLYETKGRKRNLEDVLRRARLLPFVSELICNTGVLAERSVDRKGIVSFGIAGRARIDGKESGIKVVLDKKPNQRILYLSIFELEDIKKSRNRYLDNQAAKECGRSPVFTDRRSGLLITKVTSFSLEDTPASGKSQVKTITIEV